ncbi:SMP-30/gluconolactonase/LRE family protein [Actinokineospora sp.]|uniref:SMP-30/gluconolactonase/LRE family protein n=1 Tax=Actinokineospora sp. TaxID=1872133 RepID=UPI00403766BF
MGEPAPAHRYPLLLGVGLVGILATLAGLFVGTWLVLAGAIVAVAGFAAFLLAPSPIDPRGWQPPPAPAMVGVLAPNRTLADAEILAAGQVSGPEDLVLTPDGRTLFASSFGDGRIVRIDVTGKTPRVVDHAKTGGSPVDMALRSDGSLVVCDWSKGLLLVSPAGQVSTLLPLGTPIDGRPFVRPDGVSEAADGTLYLSEGSDRPGVWNGVFEALEANNYGRVVAFDPATGVAWTVVDGLSFANGNAIEPGGRFLVVADQYRYRIARLWLTGPDAGRIDTFAENLPGLPHNMRYDADGVLWVGLYQGRDATLDRISPRPGLKRIIAKLPATAVAGPERIAEGKPGRGAVIALDQAGRPVRYFAGPPSRVDTVSAVVRHGNSLYVSTLTGDAILRLRLPA